MTATKTTIFTSNDACMRVQFRLNNKPATEYIVRTTAKKDSSNPLKYSFLGSGSKFQSIVKGKQIIECSAIANYTTIDQYQKVDHQSVSADKVSISDVGGLSVSHVFLSEPNSVEFIVKFTVIDGV